MGASRRRPKIDPRRSEFRILRNAQAIRLLECDHNYCQSVLKRRLDQLNKISSDAHLLDLRVSKSEYDASFMAAFAGIEQRYVAKVSDAKLRHREQLLDLQQELSEITAQADAEERLARDLSEQEREHYEREAEARVCQEQLQAAAEYERLEAELAQLKAERDVAKKNREKMLAIKAEMERDERPEQPKKPPASGIGRILLAPPKPKTPTKKVFL
jgi:septal ring factor EnvC (AmiA/AmiB activator)